MLYFLVAFIVLLGIWVCTLTIKITEIEKDLEKLTWEMKGGNSAKKEEG